MLVIEAPRGSELIVDSEEKGECLLRMNARQQGKIQVYSCTALEGVKPVQIQPRQ